MTRKPRPPRGPNGPDQKLKLFLKDLAGMAAARSWGEQLAVDLKDFADGRIEWKDVDPGLLIYGEPGTGKTTFAKALANTCGISFIATSYAQWQRAGQGYLGDVLQAMQADFAKAESGAPSLLFIDEIDTFPTRGNTMRNNEWWTSVVNALLEKLDGIGDREGVVVIGACNDPSGIDPALLRAGRFDRKIQICMPTIPDLERILKLHLPNNVRGIEDLPSVAILCSGMTGADIKKLVRDSARLARQQRRTMSLQDVVAAIEGGRPAVSPEFLRRIAIHEAGHALAALQLNLTTNINVSVVNTGSTWGRTVLQHEHAIHLTREGLDATLAMLLAGRAAEMAVLGSVSGGAGGSRESDLAAATRLATDIVCSFGLSDKHNLAWQGQHSVENPVLSDRRIFDEVSDILNKAYGRSLALLKSDRAIVEAIADALLTKRALAHDALITVVAAARSMKRGDGMDVVC